MRDFMEGAWPAIVFALILIGLLAFLVFTANTITQQEAVCERNGYAGTVRLNSETYCYRLDGNRLEGVLLEALGK